MFNSILVQNDLFYQTGGRSTHHIVAHNVSRIHHVVFFRQVLHTTSLIKYVLELERDRAYG
jgi:hypothetical protein